MTLDMWMQPFALPFMQHAFLAAVLVAVPAGLLSCYLVLKGWSLMGDAVSHAVLPGVVLSYMLKAPLLIGAFAAGMTCALTAGFLQQNSRIKSDTVLGVVFSGMFGLGIVMYAGIRTDVHLEHILFGDLLGVSAAGLLQTGLIAAAVSAMLLLRRRDLLLFAFDPVQARAIGLPTGLLHYGLLALLSLTVVGALTASGIILTIAMLITPGAIAFLLTRRFDRMLLLAAAAAVIAAVAGVYAAFFIDSAPAPTIVLVLMIEFVLAFLIGPRTRVGARADATLPDPA